MDTSVELVRHLLQSVVYIHTTVSRDHPSTKILGNERLGSGVVPDGPGDRGGLQDGDVIVSLNAEEVASRRDFYMSLWRHEPGEPLTFEVKRDNKMRRFEVKGGDRAHFYRQL